MSDLQFFSVLIFLATVLIVLAVYSSFIAPRQSRNKVNRRVSLLQQGKSGAETLDLLRQERWLGGASDGTLGHFRRLAMQSGIRLDRSDLLGRAGLIFIACFALLSQRLGLSMTALLAALPASLVVVYLWFRRSRAKRIARFREQLPEVLDLLVRSLRAGHPLPVSFALAAREMQDPAGSEFGMVSDEVQFGASVPAAIKAMAARVGDPDLDYLVTCVTVQSQTGGNLGEVLSRLSRLIRDRSRLSRKVKALTSEARFSAIALSLFPAILFVAINLLVPNYYAEVWNTPAFSKTLFVGIAMLTVGNLVMRQLSNLKY